MKRLSSSIFLFKLIVIQILFFITYEEIISQYFSYLGFEKNPIKPLEIVVVLFLNLIIIKNIDYKANSIKELFKLIFVVLCIIPVSILFIEGTTNPVIYFCYAMVYLLISLPFKRLNFNFRRIATRQIHPFTYLCIAIFIIPFILQYQLNINLNNLILIDVYDTREITSLNTNRLLDYLYFPLTSVLLPIGIIQALISKKRYMAGILILLNLYMFLIGAHKQVLFNLLLVLSFYFFRKTSSQNIFTNGVILILSIGLIEFFVLDTYLISNYLTRRIAFLPAILDKYYFDFFEGNYLYWSNSWLKFILEYPYDIGVPNLIAGNYLGDWKMASNNGIISDGFSQAGFLGIIINGVIISLVLNYLNNQRISKLYSGLIFIFLINIISTNLSTVLFTHGGILLIILSSLILQNSNRDDFTFN